MTELLSSSSATSMLQELLERLERLKVELLSSSSATSMLPLALRPRGAAKALSISERTLWQMTKDGKIPCIRVGTGKRNDVRYPVRLLEAWLDEQGQAGKGGDDVSA